jgi:hypothetical protein
LKEGARQEREGKAEEGKKQGRERGRRRVDGTEGMHWKGIEEGGEEEARQGGRKREGPRDVPERKSDHGREVFKGGRLLNMDGKRGGKPLDVSLPSAHQGIESRREGGWWGGGW